MATTTLRVYLNELQSLLESESLEELIGHCRHIIQHYPKNVEAYRILGQALLERSRRDEASDVFLRVLGAIPDDFIAHVGLSAAREEADINAAIWHLERAAEQQSNNQAIQDEILRLYARRDGSAPAQSQMTRGMLARVYLRSQLFSQAILELQSALAEAPSRFDLATLLARTLWESGHPLEASDLALQILQAAPDNLEANQIMASLWLSQGRASDAEAYLSRLEMLDPFLAWKIVHSDKKPVPRNAFQLTRLKWDARAAAAMMTDVPDWVSTIGDVLEAPEAVPLSDVQMPSAPASSAQFGAFTVSPDDPYSQVGPGRSRLSSRVEPSSAPASPATPMPDWYAEFAEPAATADDAALDFDALGLSFDDVADSGPATAAAQGADGYVPEWLEDAAAEVAPPPPAEDALGWLMTGPLPEPPAAPADDIPDWLTTGPLPDMPDRSSAPDRTGPPGVSASFAVPAVPTEDALDWLTTGPLPDVPDTADVADLPELPETGQRQEPAMADWLASGPLSDIGFEMEADNANGVRMAPDALRFDWPEQADPLSAADDWDDEEWLSESTEDVPAEGVPATTDPVGELDLEWLLGDVAPPPSVVADQTPTEDFGAAMDWLGASSSDFVPDTTSAPSMSAGSLAGTAQPDYTADFSGEPDENDFYTAPLDLDSALERFSAPPTPSGASAETNPPAMQQNEDDLTLDWIGVSTSILPPDPRAAFDLGADHIADWPSESAKMAETTEITADMLVDPDAVVDLASQDVRDLFADSGTTSDTSDWLSAIGPAQDADLPIFEGFGEAVEPGSDTGVDSLFGSEADPLLGQYDFAVSDVGTFAEGDRAESADKPVADDEHPDDPMAWLKQYSAPSEPAEMFAVGTDESTGQVEVDFATELDDLGLASTPPQAEQRGMRTESDILRWLSDTSEAAPGDEPPVSKDKRLTESAVLRYLSEPPEEAANALGATIEQFPVPDSPAPALPVDEPILEDEWLAGFEAEPAEPRSGDDWLGSLSTTPSSSQVQSPQGNWLDALGAVSAAPLEEPPPAPAESQEPPPAVVPESEPPAEPMPLWKRESVTASLAQAQEALRQQEDTDATSLPAWMLEDADAFVTTSTGTLKAHDEAPAVEEPAVDVFAGSEPEPEPTPMPVATGLRGITAKLPPQKPRVDTGVLDPTHTPDWLNAVDVVGEDENADAMAGATTMPPESTADSLTTLPWDLSPLAYADESADSADSIDSAFADTVLESDEPLAAADAMPDWMRELSPPVPGQQPQVPLEALDFGQVNTTGFDFGGSSEISDIADQSQRVAPNQDLIDTDDTQAATSKPAYSFGKREPAWKRKTKGSGAQKGTP